MSEIEVPWVARKDERLRKGDSMKRSSLLLVAAALGSVLSVLGTGYAADCGQGGSPTNGSGSCDTPDDQVQCGSGTDTGAGVVSASATGAEFCNEGDVLPVQGRVGAQQECSCAYIDGDEDNNHDLLLNGWARIDQEGVHCRERSKPGSQSYNSSPGSDLQGCAG